MRFNQGSKIIPANKINSNNSSYAVVIKQLQITFFLLLFEIVRLCVIFIKNEVLGKNTSSIISGFIYHK